MMLSGLLIALLIGTLVTVAWKMPDSSKATTAGWIVTFIISTGVVILGFWLHDNGIDEGFFNYITTTRVF